MYCVSSLSVSRPSSVRSFECSTVTCGTSSTPLSSYFSSPASLRVSSRDLLPTDEFSIASSSPSLLFAFSTSLMSAENLAHWFTSLAKWYLFLYLISWFFVIYFLFAKILVYLLFILFIYLLVFISQWETTICKHCFKGRFPGKLGLFNQLISQNFLRG